MHRHVDMDLLIYVCAEGRTVFQLVHAFEVPITSKIFKK